MPGTDRVQVVKRESAALGGNAAEDLPFDAPIDPQEDALECAGVYLQDASNRDQNIYVDRAGSDLRFRDLNNTTPLTLSRVRGQTVFSEVTSDTTTSSTTFVDLLTSTITTVAGTKLVVLATFATSNSNSNAQQHFRLLVDGVVKRGCGLRYTNVPSESGSIAFVIAGLSSGSHTIKLQWRADASGGTVRIRPVAAPDDEHASLVVQEVAA